MSNLETLVVSRPEVSIAKAKTLFNVGTSGKFAATKSTATRQRKAVKKYLEVSNTSQRLIADKIGISQLNVSKYLAKKSIPSKDAEKIVNYLAVAFNSDKATTKTSVTNNANNSFNNFEGDKKANARNLMINSIINTNVTSGKVLTLPSSECKLELKLASEYPNDFHYVGCEMDLETYKTMQKVASENDLLMDTVYGKIGEVITKSNTNDFKHIILDYCGQFSTFENEIKYAIQNNLVEVNGTISLTISKCRDTNTCNNTKNNYAPNVLEQLNMNTTELGVLNSLNKFDINNNYQITEFFPYHDTSAMLLVVIKRVS